MQTVRAVRSGEMLAEEALEHAIARIEVTDSRVNAFTDGTFERAVRQARAIDKLRASGAALPLLAGLPYAVKNLFDIQGLVTRAGSKVRNGEPPAQADAVLVQRMEAAGAVLVGALNMDEFAYGFTTENSHHGPTRNPRDLSRTAGGSSGGCAAAVAAGQVPVTLGSDTNGSIRVPSSLCGVFGLKPTFGRLSRRGSFPFVASIDHLGPFARSVEDLAATYDAMQGPDPLDRACHATRVQPTLPSLNDGVRGLRIGLLAGYFEDHAGEAARKAAGTAAEALGALRGVVWPDAALARAAAFIVTASEGGALHLPLLRERAAEFEPLSVDRFIAGALQPAAWYIRAQRFRAAYRQKVQDLFKDWDVLIAPATPITAPTIGTETFELNGRTLPARPSLGLLTQPVSFSGCPVVAAPLWPTAALPMGVQLIAAPWREDLALRAARVLEAQGVAKSPVSRW
ncbi:AtzE family amidohydrolase [Piscinibacter terrae]|uniref:AtzE family amidohydrolase n=1 Tax=Piscinibacter terrae TaxID=2496871 RepID=A0A3N7HH00_9BURK|nr:AtzE family amidohydrolase [Albitalea terrae]RQP21290.1 AtzE family amidohydrolase [Albitalea terrae]